MNVDTRNRDLPSLFVPDEFCLLVEHQPGPDFKPDKTFVTAIQQALGNHQEKMIYNKKRRLADYLRPVANLDNPEKIIAVTTFRRTGQERALSMLTVNVNEAPGSSGSQGLIGSLVDFFVENKGQLEPVDDDKGSADPLPDEHPYAKKFGRKPGGPIGRSFISQRVTDPQKKVSIRAVGPDWFVSPCGEDGDGTGGPGSRPIPVHRTPQDADYGFYSLSGTRWWLDSSAKIGSKVRVVILDSIPKDDELDKGGNSVGLKDSLRGKNNRLLSYLLDLQKNQQFTITPADAGILPDPAVFGSIGLMHPQDMLSNHGLFVTGIIASFMQQMAAMSDQGASAARNICLDLVQVLNHSGVASLKSLAFGFNKALEKRRDDEHLIVNASLYISLRLIEIYGKELAKLIHAATDMDGLTPAEWREFVSHTVAIAEVNNAEALEFSRDDLRPPGEGKPLQLLIAAAGNDGREDLVRMRERRLAESHEKNLEALETAPLRAKGPVGRPAGYPASGLNAVGVGALDKTGQQVATYSNLADQPEWQGFYAFGGATNPPGDINEQPANSVPGASAKHTTDQLSKEEERARHEAEKTKQEDKTTPKARPKEGILGLYISGEPPNQTEASQADQVAAGWAEWSGTSFATAVVTGIATCLLAQGETTPITTMTRHCDPAKAKQQLLFLDIMQGQSVAASKR